jgi:hypothetical protein
VETAGAAMLKAAGESSAGSLPPVAGAVERVP